MFSRTFCGFILIGILSLCVHFSNSTCGYDDLRNYDGAGNLFSSCPKIKDGYLNVHLVPHSHDDVGWLKTVDQYYYGAKNSIQQAAVQYILDSTIEELQKSSDRRFIYVETGFFWRWWTNQDKVTQGIVRKLITSGQLEFINGGWCMNDEATTHYNEIIDQMSLGLRFLNDTFGQCGLPRVAWQIDPFGHSREQASLFAQMGFDGLFFGRLDYQDKFFRRLGRNMETIWSGSPNNLGKDAWLFTGVLFNGYNPPDGYCFDILCSDDPIMDDPKLLGYNLDKKVDEFIKVSNYWATPYRTNNVLMTMGSDFQYMAARMWYQNLDKLIKHVNARQSEGSKVNLIYSTPSCYLHEVHKANLTWSIKKDDFFPYASDPQSFWTGYFTSRPALKYFIHRTNNFFQVCKQLATMPESQSTEETLEKIRRLAEPMAVAQHHDAVSGTAKQHVTNDYSLRLSLGIQSCEEVINSALLRIQAAKDNENESNDIFPSLEENQESENSDMSQQNFQFCHQLNISSCAASEFLGRFVLSVYNPLARDVVDTYLRLPVSTPSWRVHGPDGQLASQSIVIPKPVFNIPGRNSSALYELIVPAGTLKPLSVTNFEFVRIDEDTNSPENSKPEQKNRGSDIIISNAKGVGFVLDGMTGLIKCISHYNNELQRNVSVPLKQNFYYYKGMAGNNEKPIDRASGAYIFRPNGTLPLPVTSRVAYSVYTGEHVTEVHQTFTNWLSQVVRLYDSADSIEFEWLIGPIPTEDNVGKEIITKFTTDLKSEGTFYTDANGREILKRKRNFRPTWRYKVNEPVAGNYYPVNSRMLITESGDLTESNTEVGKTLILLNDRAQGGTSMKDGELEIMVHRRLLYDDAFGVGETLNEQAFGTGLVIRGKHWLLLAGVESGVPVSIHRSLAQQIFMDRMYAFQPSTGRGFTQTKVSEELKPFGVKLGQILPNNVNLLTLENLSIKQILIRFEHFYETGEDVELSKPTRISMVKLREIFGFKEIRETTLGGNQWKNEATRFDWNVANAVASESLHLPTRNNSPGNRDVDIILRPMEIKTFIITV